VRARQSLLVFERQGSTCANTVWMVKLFATGNTYGGVCAVALSEVAKDSRGVAGGWGTNKCVIGPDSRHLSVEYHCF